MRVDERALTERLIRYDTSDDEGIRQAAGFVKGWLESRDIPVEELEIRGLPLLAASVGSDHGPTIVLHGHLDVVPAHAEQFEPRVEGDRILGRGAYDMKGALAAMMGAVEELRNEEGVRVVLAIVPDEESEEEVDRGTQFLIQNGFSGDFAITGEPTDLHVGVQAKGVLAMRLEISGTAAHGATPWLGDNAILKALDAFRAIETLPFARESSDLFDRPSINLGRILGGDALNKVPDSCVIDVDIRYLPGQDPAEIRKQVSDLPAVSLIKPVPPRARDRRSQQPVRARVERKRVHGARFGDDQRRPRRRLRRDLLHRRRRTGGRVRAHRRRPPRSGRVGVRVLAGDLPAHAGRLRAPHPRPDERRQAAFANCLRNRSWERLIIVVLAAGATTATALLVFEDTVDKFKPVQGGTGRELTPVGSGSPQTIMIAGSDRRHGDKKLGLKPRSDTIILARIEPGKGVALLSLPRDLKVEIPGHGTDKLNVAYTLGGPKLSIKTVKNLTGLAINHYVDVSFHGFAEGVNALGCVYVDIDRRYFNNNAGLGFGQNYAVINVKPGYQKMCGQRALEYVRYRHTDNDIVRGARQQDFLRQVRSQVTARKLFDNVDKLIDIFADNTRSDIQSTGALRRLLRVMLGVESKPIKQVKFHGRLGESYVTASSRADQGRHAPVPLPAPGEGTAEQEPQALEDRSQGPVGQAPRRTSSTSPSRAAARDSSRRTASASPSTTRASW